MFPIVDISYAVENYGFEQLPSQKFVTDAEVREISKKLMDGFNNWGFIYLKGYGIPNEKIENAFEISKDFFKRSTEEKNRISVSSLDVDKFYGYVPFQYENFDSTKPYDLKEAFDYLPWMDENMRQKIPVTFAKMFDDLYDYCMNICRVLFRLLSIGLNQDAAFLEKCHKGFKTNNITILRSLYYPAVNKNEIQPLQSRCGEHSDYGTITLLFQDNVGGLEVQSPNGEFISATPLPETIVVNAADLLERWSSGKIKSTLHRVKIPKDLSKPRQSIAFFCQPDNDCVVSCLDGVNKYPAVNSKDYIFEKFKQTYTTLKTV